MKVSSPDGTTWRVSRRWVPWRRRLKGALDGVPDLGIGSLGDDPISVIVGIVLLIILIPFILLALVAGVELLLVLLVLPFAVLGRMLLGRHWTVEVRRGWRPYAEEQAGDWQASGLRVHALADDLRRGNPPPQTLNVPKG
ncbi:MULTISPECIES: hypothetical protein [unclassified Nocardioides]|uniref:hypothetical protein n=1 Tax=unclassified Nocardioides TaxID=2615069 RepID=UPI0009F0CDA4|nr:MULTISPECIES: hypothetical protein [unclassified Nocardioides]GAW50848.1 uncharacterized protein PD653B2_3184 [Nocardioides sp. PD653-B2]GAW52787.1 uncharacterized protein PD653_0180 [Nocardioides sp. PD653]